MKSIAFFLKSFQTFFKDALKNMYCLRNPYSVNLRYENDQCISNTPPKAVYDLAMTSRVKSPAGDMVDAVSVLPTTSVPDTSRLPLTSMVVALISISVSDTKSRTPSALW